MIPVFHRYRTYARTPGAPFRCLLEVLFTVIIAEECSQSRSKSEEVHGYVMPSECQDLSLDKVWGMWQGLEGETRLSEGNL